MTPPPPLNIFQVVLMFLGMILAILAAFTRNDADNVLRTRLLAASLACWFAYALLLQIGGLVKG